MQFLPSLNQAGLLGCDARGGPEIQLPLVGGRRTLSCELNQTWMLSSARTWNLIDGLLKLRKRQKHFRKMV